MSAPQASSRPEPAAVNLRPVERAPEALAEVVSEVLELIEQCRRADRRCVLGLATGSTMLGFYAELVRRVRSEKLDLSGLRSFNLDEFVGLAPDHPQSFAAYMRAHLIEPAGLDPACVRIPDGELARQDPRAVAAAYEQEIDAAGGLELQLLGLGRNGHIGFNEPGSPRDSRTRQVDLADSTREDAAGAFGGLDAVPRHAITMGVATILDARRVRVLAFGERKADAVAATLRGDGDAAWPCSYLGSHPDVRLYVDGPAGQGR